MPCAVGGLGSRLIDAFARQAGGTISIDSDRTGTIATLLLGARGGGNKVHRSLIEVACAMKHAHNLYRSILQAIQDEIGSDRDRLRRWMNIGAPCAARRAVRQPARCGEYSSDRLIRRVWIVLRDIVPDSIEIRDGRRKPPNGERHRLAAANRSRPRRAISSGSKFPATAGPLAMPSSHSRRKAAASPARRWPFHKRNASRITSLVVA